MKHTSLFTAVILLASLLAYAVQPDENILYNGAFTTTRPDAPPSGWAGGQNIKCVEFHSSGGPEDKPYISFFNFSGAPISAPDLRQYGLTLVAGERYRISVWVRGRDVSGVTGAVIANAGWASHCGPSGFSGTFEWRKFEQEVDLLESAAEGSYFAAVFAENFQGEIDFADFRLTALSEKARQLSKGAPIRATLAKPVLVPWEPRLHRIPADNPKLTFRLFAPEWENTNGLELTLSASDVPDNIVTVPLQRQDTAIPLPTGARHGNLSATIRDARTGETLLACTYKYTVVDIPQVSTAGHHRLNNLATEVLNEPLAATTEPQVFRFTLPQDTWVYLALQDAEDEPFAIILDNSDKCITATTPRHEVFRWLEAGEHTLTVSDASNGGKAIGRAIAETFNYPPGGFLVTENPPYDAAYHAKHAMGAIITENGGEVPDYEQTTFHSLGHLWLANLNCAAPSSPELLTGLLQGASGMTAPNYDGVTCDEQFFSRPATLANYAAGLRAYENPLNRLIYTWAAQSPSNPGIDDDFMAAAVDASRGRGKLLLEIYCGTKPTEAAARDYLDGHLGGMGQRLRSAPTGVLAGSGIILGDFNQMPYISLHHHPEVDFKYYLDMQLNLLANDPRFDGLGCVGYWGSYYADDEVRRWAYRLLRHYCVEGKTTMLSDEYGFTYCPGHVRNGDFADGFEGWEIEGKVTLENFSGLGAKSEVRWGGGSCGDTCAVIHKTDGETSSLRQTARGLVPGKTYLLQFCTFDADLAKNQTPGGRDFGVRATLGGGATVREELSWQHIDTRKVGERGFDSPAAQVNLHHIVFTANASEVAITLDNALAKPGENLGVNFFAVTPYYLDEDL